MNQIPKTAVATSLPRITVYIDPELKQKLERLATVERRSISQMVVVLVEDGIKKAESEGKLDKQ